MTTASALLAQRAFGSVHVRMERTGPAILRDEGAAKCRLPRGSSDAILINTSGGLAGGDRVEIRAEAGAGAALTLTSQAAERVYRTLGPAAHVSVDLSAEAGARLFWLPQETILFEGASLTRRISVDLAEDATFLAAEAMVFGRRAMGEHVNGIQLRDRWSIRRAGTLIHAEALALGPDFPSTPATLEGAHAVATVLLVSAGAERLLDQVRALLGPRDGASAWNGKLIARCVADDSLALRKTLVPLLSACVGPSAMPKVWSL
jgi:urease accessory protein